MKKTVLICLVLFCSLSSMKPANLPGNGKKFPSLIPSISDELPAVTKWVDSFYAASGLQDAGLKKEAFYYASKGYQYLLSNDRLDKKILTICDYSQSSKNKRLYVIDMETGELLFNTYVSHGKNSGLEYATSFSNKPESHKSSLGFMITANTYTGKAGYSLRLNGVEEDINDNVNRRDIVMHGSYYVNESRADEGSNMGRSFGCPAVPYALHKKIINTIKEGSCFFVFSKDQWYATTSKILRARFMWPSADYQYIVNESPVQQMKMYPQG